MDKFTAPTENYEVLSHRNSQSIKKFVIQVYEENIDFIDSMNAESKNILINRLIERHRLKFNARQKQQDKINFWKKAITTILIAIIGVPVFIMLINFSFDVTINSYTQMEKNFRKLFD